MRYDLPDMQDCHITEAHKNLDTAGHYQHVVLRNISDAVLMLPKRIIKKAGVGDRCFWEVS